VVDQSVVSSGKPSLLSDIIINARIKMTLMKILQEHLINLY